MSSIRLIGMRGLTLIKTFEDCRLEAYRDIGGVLTIGYGHTRNVKEGQTITHKQAIKKLSADIILYSQAVHKEVDQAEQHVFDALVCFAFNVGVTAFKESTLLKKYKQGKLQEAANEFLRWNKVNGKVVNGLTRRRKVERALFLNL